MKNLEFFPMFKFDFSKIPPQIEKLRIFSYVQIRLFWNTPPPLKNLEFFPKSKFDFSEILISAIFNFRLKSVV